MEEEEVFSALSHELRRKIIRSLSRGSMHYSELMDELGVDSPKLSFHLKRLSGFVDKNDETYHLTKHGRCLSDLLVIASRDEPQLTESPLAEVVDPIKLAGLAIIGLGIVILVGFVLFSFATAEDVPLAIRVGFILVGLGLLGLIGILIVERIEEIKHDRR